MNAHRRNPRTCIISVLHNRHKLDGIVSEVLNTGEHVLGELFVLPNSRFCGGNTDMCLIDAEVVGFRWARVLELISLGGRRVPKTGIVNGRHGQVLGDTFNPGREPFDTFT